MTLLAKPDQLFIENWRAIILWNVDYKALSLVFAQRLKRDGHNIVNETQSAFMSGRHISNNIRFTLDLLDFSDKIEAVALIVFLDFYKAAKDTIEQQFIFKALQAFAFGEKFISTIQMFDKDINSRVVLEPFTSKRFSVQRSVRQGRPVSPFLFVMVTELWSRSSLNTPKIQAPSILNREIRVSQLADDPEWFLQNKKQLEAANSHKHQV